MSDQYSYGNVIAFPNSEEESFSIKEEVNFFEPFLLINPSQSLKVFDSH